MAISLLGAASWIVEEVGVGAMATIGDICGSVRAAMTIANHKDTRNKSKNRCARINIVRNHVSDNLLIRKHPLL